MSKLVFKGTVSDTSEIDLPRTMRKAIANTYKGKSIKVTIEQAKTYRSGSQNRYLWGGVYQEALFGFQDAAPKDHANLTTEDIHEFFKGKFLKKRTIKVPSTGEVFELLGTTTNLNKEQFSDYIESIAKFCAEFLNVAITSSEDFLNQ